MKYEKWLSEWMKNYILPISKARTIEHYEALIRIHIIPNLGDKELSELKLGILQSFVAGLLSKKYPKTGRAFRMVQGLDEMYRCTHPKEADKVFNRLTSWLKRSRLEPMKKVADALRKHKKSIFGYFFARVTNAVAEGINSIIQSAKRRARGYRTLESYKYMICLVAGKLTLNCPPLFA